MTAAVCFAAKLTPLPANARFLFQDVSNLHDHPVDAFEVVVSLLIWRSESGQTTPKYKAILLFRAERGASRPRTAVTGDEKGSASDALVSLLDVTAKLIQSWSQRLVPGIAAKNTGGVDGRGEVDLSLLAGWD